MSDDRNPVGDLIRHLEDHGFIQVRGALDLTPRELYAFAFIYAQLRRYLNLPRFAGKRLVDMLKVVDPATAGNVVFLLAWAGFPVPEGWDIPERLVLPEEPWSDEGETR